MHAVRRLRGEARLTQAELAERAGVSRQLVGAVEAGRHLPRVDAAVALAGALGVAVESLFGSDAPPVDVVTGELSPEGGLVRLGRVGDRAVAAPARLGPDGWDVADAVIDGGTAVPLTTAAPGIVVAGCEPGLQVLERLLREGGMAAVAAVASSRAAVAALDAGRAHAAVVHGPAPDARPDVDRYRLARWRVGLGAPADAPTRWAQDALRGAGPVVQREQGAGVQRAFEEAAGAEPGTRPGPRAASHLEAARRAVFGGLPAVTIEPAAVAVGAAFHPLETHEAQLWVGRRWREARAVQEALHVIGGRRFQRRLAGVGGYDLAGCGTRAA